MWISHNKSVDARMLPWPRLNSLDTAFSYGTRRFLTYPLPRNSISAIEIYRVLSGERALNTVNFRRRSERESPVNESSTWGVHAESGQRISERAHSGS